MLNKKAQDLSIGTLILMVLGIIVLVLLVMGFAMGWDKLWDRINIFGGEVTIDDKVLGCIGSAQRDRVTEYCTTFESIDYDGKKVFMNCQFGPVEDRLTETINCPLEESDNIKNECLRLIKEGDLKQDTRVNELQCYNYYTCDDYEGKLETKASGETDAEACEDAVSGEASNVVELTKAIKTGVKDIGVQVCCVEP